MDLLCEWESGETTSFVQKFLSVNSKSCVELTLLNIQDDFMQALQCLWIIGIGA